MVRLAIWRRTCLSRPWSFLHETALQRHAAVYLSIRFQRLGIAPITANFLDFAARSFLQNPVVGLVQLPSGLGCRRGDFKAALGHGVSNVLLDDHSVSM